jgi:hypothetical protein
MRVLVSRFAALLLLLSLHLAHSRLLGLSLLLDMLDKLGDTHPSLLGIGSQLSLHRLDLFGRWALAGGGHWDLTRARHLAWLWGSGSHDSGM